MLTTTPGPPGERPKCAPRTAVLYCAPFPAWNSGEIADAHLCCGSAGTYNIDQPAIAASLGEKEGARGRRHCGAAVVASGNIGCLTRSCRVHLAKLGSAAADSPYHADPPADAYFANAALRTAGRYEAPPFLGVLLVISRLSPLPATSPGGGEISWRRRPRSGTQPSSLRKTSKAKVCRRLANAGRTSATPAARSWRSPTTCPHSPAANILSRLPRRGARIPAVISSKCSSPGTMNCTSASHVKFAADHGFVNHFVKLRGLRSIRRAEPEGEAGYKHTKSFKHRHRTPKAPPTSPIPRSPSHRPASGTATSYWPEMRSWQNPDGSGTSYYGNDFRVPLEVGRRSARR